MILLIHRSASELVKVKRGDKIIETSSNINMAFWELAQKYPEEIIGWCEESLVDKLNIEAWPSIFHHDLIMASYAFKTIFLPRAIGYVDQLPFINVPRDVKYPSWLMSSDVGGIKGKTLLQFKSLFSKIKDFGYLLNAIAKIGQQNSLFCYSDPALIKLDEKIEELKCNASTTQLFSFVYQHYNSFWTSILFWCLIYYEKKTPIFSYLLAFFNKKRFKSEIDLSEVHSSSVLNLEEGVNLDIIIPTIGRSQYLLKVLEDLSIQTFLPERVIIIEQNPEKDSISELSFLYDKNWPFEIVHHFIHHTGACNARNIALNEVKAKWIFFADDDIRLNKDLLETAFIEINKYNISALNMNCKQEEQKTVFHKIKQWGAFGSGTAIVSSEFALQCRFSEIYEYGFGEDTDFGLQLRAKGADVIYHPDVQITHLKAERGGFRGISIMPWDESGLTPKPSPTMMVLVKSHFNLWMQRGYKVTLFLKFYNKQPIKNPVVYLKSMKKRWKLSEYWASEKLKQIYK